MLDVNINTVSPMNADQGHKATAGAVVRMSPLVRYGIAVGAAGAALLLHFALEPLWGSRLPFITFYPAVVVSAWLAGFWPGIVTTLLGAAAADYFWMPPVSFLIRGDVGDLLALLIFIGSGVVISGLNEARRRAIAEAADSEERGARLFDAQGVARREAETAEQRLQLALEAGRMGTWQWTIRTGEVKWSPGLEAIHGFAPGSFPGTFDAFQKEIHPDDRNRVLEAVADAVAQRRDHHVEYRILRPDGTLRWVEGRGQLFYDATGQPDRLVGVCSDVTDRKQAEEAGRLATRRAEEANRLKDEFLAMLSHELRTPLNATLGWAHLLSSGLLSPEKARRAAETIQRNAMVEAQLVESLLDLSRIMAGKLQLELDRADLSAIVRAAADMLRPAADEKQLALEVIVPAAPVSVVGDARRLQQVVSNLLSNAVKFTPRDGRVEARLAVVDAHVQIQVSDTGQGIRPEFLPYVFDRFTQADSASGRTYGGLGLGLAIVRELVQAHGGTVVAESPGDGQGSRFVVTLPVAAGAAVPGEPAVGTPGRAALIDGVESLADIQVLVVDDDPDARELLAVALDARGAAVRTASSVNDALDSIGRQRPDVLIADIAMPQEDGHALLRKLRALEAERLEERLPAIAVTAHASVSDRAQAMAAGYDWHLAKPVELVELTRVIANLAKTEKV